MRNMQACRRTAHPSPPMCSRETNKNQRWENQKFWLIIYCTTANMSRYTSTCFDHKFIFVALVFRSAPKSRRAFSSDQRSFFFLSFLSFFFWKFHLLTDGAESRGENKSLRSWLRSTTFKLCHLKAVGGDDGGNSNNIIIQIEDAIRVWRNNEASPIPPNGNEIEENSIIEKH